jgi:hypothetical protein
MKNLSITLLLTLLISFTASAQSYFQDVDGKTILEKSEINIIGSPFFNTEFIEGKITLTNGKKYDKIPLKYNTFKDELYFKNPKDGSLLSFVVPVKEFELSGTTYISGLPAIEKFTSKSYYGLLADGKIKLLVKNYKTIFEIKPYNSATIENKFENNESYYLLKDGAISRFKPNKKDLLILFKDKSSEIDAFLKKEKIDFKNNADLVKVFDYYGSL